MLKPSAIALALLGVMIGAGHSKADTAKNVILMISDGQGFNHLLAAEAYSGTRGVYQDFETKLGMSTYSASNAGFQTGNLGYDPAKMASDGWYVAGSATGSASAATAMYTGRKIHDNRININTDGEAVTSFFEQAAAAGRSMGAVSSVQITHATPAAVYGHNVNRDNYAQLANEGIGGSNPSDENAGYDAGNYHGHFKVLMGAGHGDYDDNGLWDPDSTDNYVGGASTWEQIKSAPAPNGWTFVDDKARFEAIAAGNDVPEKLLGIARVNQTLQYNRAAEAEKNANVPDLATMTSAALHVLDQDPDGFAVMIEGGAVDWAAHHGNLQRMLEEQMDFNDAVLSAVEWVRRESDWSETLLIVTADHETGYLLGPGGFDYVDEDGDGRYTSADTLLGYKHIEDNGPGELPGVEWFSSVHTNQLVPLFAKGAGAELFEKHVAGTDPNLAGYYGLDGAVWNGAYVDNTSVYSVMMEASGVPEPASMALLSLGGLAMVRRRRRA